MHLLSTPTPIQPVTHKPMTGGDRPSRKPEGSGGQARCAQFHFLWNTRDKLLGPEQAAII